MCSHANSYSSQFAKDVVLGMQRDLLASSLGDYYGNTSHSQSVEYVRRSRLSGQLPSTLRLPPGANNANNANNASSRSADMTGGMSPLKAQQVHRKYRAMQRASLVLKRRAFRLRQLHSYNLPLVSTVPRTRQDRDQGNSAASTTIVCARRSITAAPAKAIARATVPIKLPIQAPDVAQAPERRVLVTEQLVDIDETTREEDEQNTNRNGLYGEHAGGNDERGREGEQEEDQEVLFCSADFALTCSPSSVVVS